MLESILLALCNLLTNSCNASEPAKPLDASQAAAGQQLVELADNAPHEISGLVSSGKHPNIVWVHNDGGNTPVISAANTLNGSIDAEVLIQQSDNTDWEDIARFQQQGQSWLLLADIGDNFSTRNYLSLLAIPEPELSDRTVSPAWRLDFSYPDGARDSESIAVDPLTNEILILSKRDKPPRLYSLPLKASEQVVTANYLGELSTIPEPTPEDLEEDPWYGKHRASPTAISISNDGSQLLVVTLKDSYLYPRHADGWQVAVQQAPTVLDVVQLAQTEAGDFSADQQGVWIASEQLPAQLFYMPLKLSLKP
jgi:hypothetical protein